MRPAVLQTNRVLGENRQMLKSILEQQQQFKTKHQQDASMLKDLIESRDKLRRLVTTLSRDIERVKQQQAQRKQFARWNLLLEDRVKELTYQLEQLQTTTRKAAAERELQHKGTIDELRSVYDRQVARDAEVQTKLQATLSELRTKSSEQECKISSLTEQVQELSVKAERGAKAEQRFEQLLVATDFYERRRAAHYK